MKINAENLKRIALMSSQKCLNECTEHAYTALNNLLPILHTHAKEGHLDYVLILSDIPLLLGYSLNTVKEYGMIMEQLGVLLSKEPYFFKTGYKLDHLLTLTISWE